MSDGRGRSAWTGLLIGLGVIRKGILPRLAGLVMVSGWTLLRPARCCLKTDVSRYIGYDSRQATPRLPHSATSPLIRLIWSSNLRNRFDPRRLWLATAFPFDIDRVDHRSRGIGECGLCHLRHPSRRWADWAERLRPA